MSKEVDALFDALFALTDLRVLLRETVPFHKLNEEQQAQARSAIVNVREALSRLEGVLDNEDRK
ncbi:MAG: hypothetical protein WCI87_07310 [Euryarchaeota archaeon]